MNIPSVYQDEQPISTWRDIRGKTLVWVPTNVPLIYTFIVPAEYSCTIAQWNQAFIVWLKLMEVPEVLPSPHTQRYIALFVPLRAKDIPVLLIPRVSNISMIRPLVVVLLLI